jgi:hypothetical protein
VLPHWHLHLSLSSHIQHITNKTLNDTPYSNRNEVICNTQKSKPKNIKIENTNIMYLKKLHKHKKKLTKHKHTMFWNLKSPKKKLKSQKFEFIHNLQINLILLEWN